ncbi:outer membrane protein assembly factor BamA [Planctomycetota bacterium]
MFCRRAILGGQKIGNQKKQFKRICHCRHLPVFGSKFLCIFFLYWLSFAPLTFAQIDNAQLSGENVVISGVRTAGNLNVSSEQILGKVRSRVGDLYDEATAEKDVQRIAELPGVEYSYFNKKAVDGKIELTFVVVEKNVVRSINFIGNKGYKDKKLRKELDFKTGDYLDTMLVEAGRTAVTDYYHKKGYHFVRVGVDEAELSKGNVVYQINEGPRVRIAAVRFRGNEGIRTKKLENLIKTKQRKWFFWPNYYAETLLSEDRTELLNDYQRRGFLNTNITARRDFSEDRNKVYITFVIDEGKVYAIEEISIIGNGYFDTNQLRNQIESKAGQTYYETKTDSDTKRLLSLYRENGFINAKVQKQRLFVAEDKVRVEFAITEGQRFRIGQVNITGNKQTQDKVIRRVLDEYDFKPGNWYNADIARGDGNGYLEKRVRQMAMTESVAITPVGEAPGQRDAHVSVVEGQTGMVMVGAGVASDSGVIGQLVFEQRNFDISDKPDSFYEFITGKAFKGAGQNLRIALQPGTRVSQYSISFTEPYLNDKPISLNVVASSWERYRESYDEHRIKGYVGFEKRYKNRWRRSIGFRAENVELDNIDTDAPKEIRDFKGNTNLFGVKLGIGRELTDDKFSPTKGYIFNAGYEQVGGDNTFGVLSGSYNRYKTIFEDLAERKTVLATKLLAATTVGNAPPFEKFYAGGSGLYGIRGFDYRGVSTRGLPTDATGTPILGREKKDPIGSDWIFLASAEVTVPLVKDNFSALFFVDSGAIDSGDYRASIGAGIQILIPQWFGPVPMRFELAAPFMKDDEDETQVFSFSVGRLF